MNVTECRIHAFYDGEAQVWVAESDDIPGLVTEAESWDALVEALHHLVPELLSENEREASTVRMHLIAELTEVLPA